MARKRRPAEQRWLDKVLVGDGCWEWQGAKIKGYGVIRNDNGKIVGAHRLSYEMFVGPLPSHLQVCHRCDNPGCVKPSHLFLGTQSDNNRDRDTKGRSGLTRCKGERHGMAKLKFADVRRMRDLYQTTLISQPELARAFRISQATTNSILLRKIWRDA